MTRVYHSTRTAARLLSRELGGDPKRWEQYLKDDRARQKRGVPPVLRYETAFGDCRPSYSEGDLYRFIFASRPSRLVEARGREPNRFWCNADIRVAYDRGGELGVALFGPGISAANTWLSGDQAMHLAMQLLMKARYIAGRRVDIHADKVIADPRRTLVSDAAFGHAEGEAPAPHWTDPDAELIQLLHGLGHVEDGGHHGT